MMMSMELKVSTRWLNKIESTSNIIILGEDSKINSTGMEGIRIKTREEQQQTEEELNFLPECKYIKIFIMNWY